MALDGGMAGEIRKMETKDLREVGRAHATLDLEAFLWTPGELRARTFYRTILESREAFCYLYEVDGKVAGFISGADDVNTVRKRILLRNFFQLGWHLIKHFCKDPAKILVFAKMGLQSWRLERGDAAPEKLLSFGVLPEYRTPQFYATHRVRIARELFFKAVGEHGARGVSQFILLVGRKNMLAQIFYENLGLQRVRTIQYTGEATDVYLCDVLGKLKAPCRSSPLTT